MLTPFVKCFCTKGYTIRIGIIEKIMVADFTFSAAMVISAISYGVYSIWKESNSSFNWYCKVYSFGLSI